MAKYTRCREKYFQDTKGMYKVCLAINKEGKYLWEIYSSNEPGYWREEAHSGFWESNPDTTINEAIEILNNIHPEATEINYIECNLCIAGNFLDPILLKEEIEKLIHNHNPELIAKFN